MGANLFFRLVAILPFVFASMILGQTTETARDKLISKDYTFTIKADRGWTDTGINLSPGDRVHISGAVIDCGGPAPLEKAHLPLPSAPAGALLVKLQAEEPPVVASTDADLPIVDPSHLYLGVNGWQCQGTVPVKVQVERHKTPPQG